MASMPSNDLPINNKQPSFNQIKPTTLSIDVERCDDHQSSQQDYTKRAQWVRAAVLGANDGLLSTASLMIGVGAVRTDPKTMALTGLAGLFGGACSMAVGELVSVYSQYEIELAQLHREREAMQQSDPPSLLEDQKKALPSPFRAAAASGLAFSVGAAVPLLSASFIQAYKMRLIAVVSAVSLSLLAFGWAAATLGRAPALKSSIRVLLGGWVAMGITFGLTKLASRFTGI